MKPLIITSLTLLLVACGDTTPKSINFELRDFTIQSTPVSYGVDYDGTGELVSTDPWLRGRTVFVQIEWVNASDNNSRGMSSATLTDGTGVLKTLEIQTDKKKGVPSYKDWKVTAFWEVHPGTIEVK